MTQIQKVKSNLEKMINAKKSIIREISEFVQRYDGIINFDSIQSEEPNVVLPIDYMFSKPIMIGAYCIRYDESIDTAVLDAVDEDGEEFIVDIDELSTDGLYKLVYWLDLYEKEMNEKANEQFRKEFEAIKKESAKKSTPFAHYLTTQMEFADFVALSLIIGAECKEELNAAITIASPRARFAYALLQTES